MDEDFAKRAERRRKTWKGGVLRPGDDLVEFDLNYWGSMTPAARIDAGIESIGDWWAMRGYEAEPRLCRTDHGVRKRGS